MVGDNDPFSRIRQAPCKKCPTCPGAPPSLPFSPPSPLSPAYIDSSRRSAPSCAGPPPSPLLLFFPLFPPPPPFFSFYKRMAWGRSTRLGRRGLDKDSFPALSPSFFFSFFPFRKDNPQTTVMSSPGPTPTPFSLFSPILVCGRVAEGHATPDPMTPFFPFPHGHRRHQLYLRHISGPDPDGRGAIFEPPSFPPPFPSVVNGGNLKARTLRTSISLSFPPPFSEGAGHPAIGVSSQIERRHGSLSPLSFFLV